LAEDAPIVLAYPNPMRDVLTIKLPNKNAHSLVQLINLQGQIVATANDNAQLNVAHLKAGVYFLQGVFNEKVVVQKLVKL
jgi:Secretion system C-terminal sorting domain